MLFRSKEISVAEGFLKLSASNHTLGGFPENDAFKLNQVIGGLTCCCKAEVGGAVSFAMSCFLLLRNFRWASGVGLGGAEVSAAVFFSATTSLVDVTFCFLGRGSGSSSSPLHKGEDLSSTKRLRKEDETILKLTWRSRRQNRQRRMTEIFERK